MLGHYFLLVGFGLVSVLKPEIFPLVLKLLIKHFLNKPKSLPNLFILVLQLLVGELFIVGTLAYPGDFLLYALILQSRMGFGHETQRI